MAILTFHGMLRTSPPAPLLQGDGSRYTPPSLQGKGVGGLGFPHKVKSQIAILSSNLNVILLKSVCIIKQ